MDERLKRATEALKAEWGAMEREGNARLVEAGYDPDCDLPPPDWWFERLARAALEAK